MSSFGSISTSSAPSFYSSPPSPTTLSFGLHQSPREQHNLFSQFGVLAPGQSGKGSDSQGFGSIKKLMGRK
jgi:hypothetical protein